MPARQVSGSSRSGRSIPYGHGKGSCEQDAEPPAEGSSCEIRLSTCPESDLRVATGARISREPGLSFVWAILLT